MRKSKNTFRHESLQDADSIQDVLKSISKGLSKGKLSFSNDDGEIVMEPQGLLNLRVSVRQEDNKNRVYLRISWQDEEEGLEEKLLTVK